MTSVINRRMVGRTWASMWFKCCNKRSSRNVRFAWTSVSNGRSIFLMATVWLVVWEMAPAGQEPDETWSLLTVSVARLEWNDDEFRDLFWMKQPTVLTWLHQRLRDQCRISLGIESELSNRSWLCPLDSRIDPNATELGCQRQELTSPCFLIGKNGNYEKLSEYVCVCVKSLIGRQGIILRSDETEKVPIEGQMAAEEKSSPHISPTTGRL